MAQKPLTTEQCQEVVDARARHKTLRAAAISLCLPENTFKARLLEARRRGVVATTPVPQAGESLAAGETLLELPKNDVYVVTCAQNATPVHRRFFRALQRYCQRRRAQLVVVPIRYKNPTSRWTKSQDNEENWAPELAPYLFAGRANLNDNLRLLADIKVQPTASNPLSSFGSISGPASGILGHPKLAMAAIATPHGRLPKCIYTTGAVTVKNYTDSRSGKAGEFHHTFGALVVEIQDRQVAHVRQINATKDGSFIELDKKYSARGVSPAGRAPGLVMGDRHEEYVDPQVDAATFGPGGIVRTLQPRELVWHDLFDCYSVNHHHRGNPFLHVAKHRAGANSAAGEVEKTVAALGRHTPPGTRSVVVASNHDEALGRWLRETDWRGDPANAEFYLETALELVRSAKMTLHGSEYADPFHYWARKLLPTSTLKRIRLLGRNDSHQIAGIEVSFHGDRGANGARGSRVHYRRTGSKSVIGHSHTPGIDEGCYQVGTSSFLRLEYNTGLSSWMQTHCVIYANGKRSLLHVIGGNWRLSRRQRRVKR